MGVVSYVATIEKGVVPEAVLSDVESVYDQTEAVEMDSEEKSVEKEEKSAEKEEKSVEEEEKSVEEEEASSPTEKETIPETDSSFEEKSAMEEKMIMDEKMNTVEKPSTPPTEEKQTLHECTPEGGTMEETKDFTLQINGVSIRVSARQSAKGKCTMNIARESDEYSSYYSTSNNEIEFSVEHNNRRYKTSINRDATMKMLKKRAVSVGLSREC